MDRELIMTGIGGQGVQLAAAVVARAALLEGRDVQVFGSYGGMMRGGATESTVVVADRSVESPPTVASTWSVVLMHHEHAAPVLARLDPDGVLFVNTTVVDRPDVAGGCTVIEVPAHDIAVTLGSAMAASMVMIGAYAAVTGLVGLASLSAASRPRCRPTGPSTPPSTTRPCGPGSSRCPRTVPAWPDPVARREGAAAGDHPGHPGHRRRGVQGVRPLHRRCPPGVLVMTEHEINARGYRYPRLLPGCTGCRACSQICPDFVFQVYKYETPETLPGGPA